MSETLNLYRLQQLDNQIDAIQTRLSEVDESLSDDRRVKTAQKKLANAEAQAKAARIALGQIEDKVESQRLKRKTDQAALFGGRIKNPKELQDLQMETEALKRFIAQLEDEQLEAMIASESAENALEQATLGLQQAKGTAAEQNASLLGEKSKLEEDLERFLRERDAVYQSIPAVAIELYEKLKQTKRGTAVACVTDSGCSICGQALTPAVLQTIRASNSLVFCPSCGRILFNA